MGKMFSQGGLTQPDSALVDPTGNAQMVGSPDKIRDTLLRSSANFKPFANSDMSTGAPPVPGQSPLHNLGIGQPSFQQAAAAGATPGGGNALSPGLSKMGKLVTLLMGGVQGALAGRAASEQAVIQSGGHRSGGAGIGAEAGFTLPWQRAQQLAQTQIAQAQAQYYPQIQQLTARKTQAETAKDLADAAKAPFVTPRGGGVFDTSRQAYVPGAGPTPQRDSTPEQQVLDYLTATPDPKLGRPLNADEAYQRINDIKAGAKPETGSDFERYYGGLVKQGTPDTPQNRMAAYGQWVKNEPQYQGAQAQRQATNAQHVDAENDRSYQFHAARLDKLRQPVEQQLDRLSRLSDTLAQGTPQSDSLVAPELLTAMAGGQGSGLRMNESELARIVGGRTNWEGIKAKLGAWQADPNKGFSLTSAQRQQVGALLQARIGRLKQQQDILDKAGDDLVSTNSPQQHRAIYNRTQQALSGAMSGGGISVTDPRGVVHSFPNQAAADQFKQAAGIR